VIPFLNAGPATLSNYQWSATGYTFKEFVTDSDLKWGHATYLSAADWQQENPVWAWVTSGSLGVGGSADAYLGGEYAGRVYGSCSNLVETPNSQLDPTIINNHANHVTPNGSEYVLNVFSANQNAVPLKPAAYFKAFVGTPVAYWAPQGVGDFAFMQILSSTISAGSGDPWFISWPEWSLDNTYPYVPSYPADQLQYPFNLSLLRSTEDTPNFTPSQTIFWAWINAFYQANEHFKMYVIYEPPNNLVGTSMVPLWYSEWKWNPGDTVVGGSWHAVPSGSVQDFGKFPAMVHPSWIDRAVNTGG